MIFFDILPPGTAEIILWNKLSHIITLHYANKDANFCLKQVSELLKVQVENWKLRCCRLGHHPKVCERNPGLLSLSKFWFFDIHIDFVTHSRACVFYLEDRFLMEVKI